MITSSPLGWQNYYMLQRKPHTSEKLSIAGMTNTVKPNKGQLLLVCYQIKQGCERQLRDDILIWPNASCGLEQQCSEWMP